MLAERAECQSCQLEVLASERDADDGDAKHDAEQQMRQANPNTTNQNPDDVHDDAEASACFGCCLDALAERAECQQAQFQGL